MKCLNPTGPSAGFPAMQTRSIQYLDPLLSAPKFTKGGTQVLDKGKQISQEVGQTSQGSRTNVTRKYDKITRK